MNTSKFFEQEVMNLVTCRGFPIVNYVLIFLIIEMIKYTTVFETSDG
jgi:hypothetical protein